MSAAQSNLRPRGFNASTVKIFETDENHLKLLDLATTGIIIDKTPTFKHLSREATQRPITSKLPNTTRYHALKLAVKHKAIIIEYESIPKAERELLSFNSIHLAAKAEAPQARFCIDPSNVGPGLEALNSDEAKELAISRYGPVENPLIEDIVYDWDEHCKTNDLTWPDFWMGREDVEGAYPQLRFSNQSTLLMAAAISATLIVIFLAGTFGWTGLPMAYGLISAAMIRLIRKRTLGVHHVFVDDFIRGGSLAQNEHDKPIVIDVIKRTFNDSAWSEEKSIGPTQSGEALGWLFTFRTGQVRPRDRAIRKLTAAFYAFPTGKALSLKRWQSLSSLAGHYAKATSCLQPFVMPLYAMTKRQASGSLKLIEPSSQATLCIEMWRVVLLYWVFNPQAFAVPLEKFVRLSSRYQPSLLSVPHFGITDASTPKLAAALYAPGSGELIAWTQYTLPFIYSDEHKATLFQNNREYLGLLLLLVLASAARPSSERQSTLSLTWCTDNTTAQAWIDHNRCKSLASQATAISIAWVQLIQRIDVESTLWRPTEQMGDIDNLTRDKATPSLLPELYVDLQTALDESKLFHQCDFTKSLDSAAARDIMFEVNNRLRSVLESHATASTSSRRLRI